jgi:hypothetical protein
MHAIQRSLIAATVVSVLALGAFRIQAHGMAAVLQDLATFPRYCNELKRELHRGEELGVEQSEVYTRVAKKWALARGVVEGDLSLREAAAKFMKLTDVGHTHWDYLAEANPSMSLEVRCGHYMVDLIEDVVATEYRHLSGLPAKCRAAVQSWESAR